MPPRRNVTTRQSEIHAEALISNLEFPLKILQIISGRNLNGALVYCKLLSENLVANGHQVTILSRDRCWIQEQIAGSGVDYEVSDLNRFPPGELRRIAAWAKRESFDVIHTHMSRANTFGVLLRMMTGLPVVATAHANHFQPHWRWNDFVIANSTATHNYQRRINLVSRKKIATVYCYTNLKRFDEVTPRSIRIVKRQLRLKGDEFLIGIVGEVLTRKGQLILVQAIPKILKEVPNAKFVFLGRFHRDENYTQQIRQFLIREKLFCRTKWLGIRDNIEDFMSAFDLCVVPSLSEPLGLVAIEALAAQTPVVATDVGGLPEIIEHEETGLLVPPKNENALAEAVIRMAKDPTLRESTGRQGREKVLRQFDPNRLTREVIEIYEQVVSRRSAA